MAKELRPGDVYVLLKRAGNYRNLFNPATGMLAPRAADGTWAPDPTAGFTEGSPWTYLFGAMHDPAGMIAFLGGRERFSARLDENFDRGHYVHENEPGHHYAYLYNDAGQPWKTQERVRAILGKQYQATPQGLKGDDDCGQMAECVGESAGSGAGGDSPRTSCRIRSAGGAGTGKRPGRGRRLP